MNGGNLLDAGDARAIVRLLGDVCGHPGDHIARKRHLMNGICGLVGATSWAWGLSAQMEEGKPSVHISLLHGGFNEETYAALIQAYSHPAMSTIHAPFAKELEERRCHLTRLNQQIDPEGKWRATEAYPLWNKAGVDSIIFSLRPLTPSTFSIVAIYRPPGAPPFSRGESRIAHILLSEVPDLHAQGWPQEQLVTLPSLSNRQRVIMEMLVHGYSRNKVAEHLQLSPHTVNDYVKGIFRHFGVHSQAELINHFRNGDGGDD